MSPHSNDLTFVPEASLHANFRGPREAEQTTAFDGDAALPSSHDTAVPNAPEGINGTATTHAENMTSTAASFTDPHTVNGTLLPTNASPADTSEEEKKITGIIVAAVITAILVVLLIGLAAWYYRRRGKFGKPSVCFEPIRKRRSSTTDSRRVLDEEMVNHADDLHDDDSSTAAKARREQDMFTIDDFEDPEDDAQRGEEYYYDEVFGQSQFEDEATQNSVRQLYSGVDNQAEEELLDFDFETLGIRIDDYKIDSSRKTH